VGSLTASYQIAASTRSFLIQQSRDANYEDLLTKHLPPVPNGHRPLLTDPSLGITIDEDKLQAQVEEPREHRPRFDPNDGSVVDWYRCAPNSPARMPALLCEPGCTADHLATVSLHSLMQLLQSGTTASLAAYSARVSRTISGMDTGKPPYEAPASFSNPLQKASQRASSERLTWWPPAAS